MSVSATVGLRPDLVGVVPAVRPPKAIKLPTVEERRLDNGVRVVAARRPGVPRVEARLLVPSTRSNKAADSAQARLLAKTLLSGTDSRSSLQIAQELQRLGGHLDAHADSDHFVVAGSALASELPAFLGLLGEILVGATHPKDEVAVQREVLAQDITLALSQPSTLVGQALRRRLFGSHPYGRGEPAPEQVMAVRAGQLRKLHEQRLRADGSILVLVGDFMPARAIDRAEVALAEWPAGTGQVGLAPPVVASPSATLLVDRPGSVQTNIRMAGPAVGRTHPDFPSLALANLIFGGYFVSRLVDNIRERRGYTYSPSSGVSQKLATAWFSVQAEVGTEVTGPALVETRYELNRMLAGPIDEVEILSAKRYLSGTLSMAIQTQAGLASNLASLAVRDLPVDYVREYPAQVERLTEADVIDAARRYMAPRNLHTVMLGDLDAMRPAVEAFDEVEIESG